MSTSIHSVILMPSSTYQIFCKDGLSPLDLHHVEKLLNFGANIKAINCGAENEYAALHQAKADMYDLMRRNRFDRVKKADYQLAMNVNSEKIPKFE